MSERPDETDARAYVETGARAVIGDLRLLQAVVDGDYDGGSDEMLESLGLEIEDGCIDVDEAIEVLYAMPLAVERTMTFEVILGTGGPDRRLCFECAVELIYPPDGRVVPTYEIRRVLYRYSWDGSAEVELVGADRQVAEAFARRVVPELA